MTAITSPADVRVFDTNYPRNNANPWLTSLKVAWGVGSIAALALRVTMAFAPALLSPALVVVAPWLFSAVSLGTALIYGMKALSVFNLVGCPAADKCGPFSRTRSVLYNFGIAGVALLSAGTFGPSLFPHSMDLDKLHKASRYILLPALAVPIGYMTALKYAFKAAHKETSGWDKLGNGLLALFSFVGSTIGLINSPDLAPRWNWHEQELPKIHIHYVDPAVTNNPDLKPIFDAKDHPHATSGWGLRNSPINGHTENHTGWDISADWGAQVHLAQVAGKVVYVGDAKNGFGKTVIVWGLDPKDSTNKYFVYSEMGKLNPSIHVGQEVLKGQDLGSISGKSGLSTGPHVHISIWTGRPPIDGHFLGESSWSNPGQDYDFAASLPPEPPNSRHLNSHLLYHRKHR